ncbi:7868_t:CDS:2 [Acaulospora colombiana]|uniref:7868_t:CDS:1 n=1 Tax=Acaulospora colombiana TaxID=27376 RepID=A0ACA9NWV3_9GLOM|nr:7868_t:CDS:2 [Acaulospora colombiana]
MSPIERALTRVECPASGGPCGDWRAQAPHRQFFGILKRDRTVKVTINGTYYHMVALLRRYSSIGARRSAEISTTRTREYHRGVGVSKYGVLVASALCAHYNSAARQTGRPVVKEFLAI